MNLHTAEGKRRTSFGERLRELRTRRGLTQKQVARAVGVSAASICIWEGGRSLPRPNMLAGLARALHVGVEELLAGEVFDKSTAALTADHVIKRARREIANALSVDVSQVRVFVEHSQE